MSATIKFVAEYGCSVKYFTTTTVSAIFSYENFLTYGHWIEVSRNLLGIQTLEIAFCMDLHFIVESEPLVTSMYMCTMYIHVNDNLFSTLNYYLRLDIEAQIVCTQIHRIWVTSYMPFFVYGSLQVPNTTITQLKKLGWISGRYVYVLYFELKFHMKFVSPEDRTRIFLVEG